MTENHRYQKVRNARLIRELSLTKGPDGRQVCDAALSAASGGLTYPEMVAALRRPLNSVMCSGRWAN